MAVPVRNLMVLLGRGLESVFDSDNGECLHALCTLSGFSFECFPFRPIAFPSPARPLLYIQPISTLRGNAAYAWDISSRTLHHNPLPIPPSALPPPLIPFPTDTRRVNRLRDRRLANHHPKPIEQIILHLVLIRLWIILDEGPESILGGGRNRGRPPPLGRQRRRVRAVSEEVVDDAVDGGLADAFELRDRGDVDPVVQV